MVEKHPQCPEAGGSPTALPGGGDSPRRLLIAAAVVGALLLLGLLRFAIDLLVIVGVIWAIGWSVGTMTDWLDGEQISKWAFGPMALTAVAVVLLLEWVGGPRLLMPAIERHTPVIVTRAMDVAAHYGWGQVVLIPNLPFARSDAQMARTLGPDPVRPASLDVPAVATNAGRTKASSRRSARSNDRLAGIDAEAADAAASHTSVRTSTTLVSSGPVVEDAVLRLTAHVTARSGEIPQGTVVFRQDRMVLGAVELDANGRATLDVRSLAPGAHRIRAEYNGQGQFEPSESAELQRTVRD